MRPRIADCISLAQVTAAIRLSLLGDNKESLSVSRSGVIFIGTMVGACTIPQSLGVRRLPITVPVVALPGYYSD
jgi:hypothetical protein